MANNDWHSPLMFGLAPLSVFWCFRRRREPGSLNESARLAVSKGWWGRSGPEAPVSMCNVAHGEPEVGDNASQREIVVIAWLYVAWQFFTWWFLTHHIDRFYVPMFSAVALLAGVGATSQARRAVRSSSPGQKEVFSIELGFSDHKQDGFFQYASPMVLGPFEVGSIESGAGAWESDHRIDSSTTLKLMSGDALTVVSTQVDSH